MFSFGGAWKTLTEWIELSVFLDSSGGGLQKATLTLTDAQIKKLPNTPIPIVASPGSGQMLVPILAIFVADSTAGAYSFDGDAKIRIVTTDGNACFGTLVEDTVEAYPLFADSLALEVVATLRSQFSSGGDGSEKTLFEDQGLAVAIAGVTDDNDFSGGDAANTLNVTILYTIVDV